MKDDFYAETAVLKLFKNMVICNMKNIEMTKSRDKWKSSMTDRERFIRQMHYQSVDRCFNMEFGFWEENFLTWNIFRNNKITNRNEADAFFGFDRFGSWYNDLECRANTFFNPAFEKKVISETQTTRILMNEDGLLAEVPKDGHNTIPHYLQSSIITPEDWRRVKEERVHLDDPARIYDVDKFRCMHPVDRSYPIGVHTGSMIGRIRDILTFEGLAYACTDYPDMVEDMVETSCLLIEQFLDQVLGKIDFDYAAGWEDICFKTGPLVRVDFFKEIVIPRYKRIKKKLESAGIDIWYVDCDGDVRPILPYLLEGGINCLFPHEVNASGHPAALLHEYGKDLRIMGGVDKMKLLEGKSSIMSYLESLLPIVERGGYIPFVDHECPPDVEPDHYLFYLDMKEKLFGGRI